MTKKFQAAMLVLCCGLAGLFGCGGAPNAPSVASPTAATLATATTGSSSNATSAPAQASAPTSVPTALPTTATPTASATNPPAGGADALDVIVEAQRAQISAKSYRSTTATTTADGKTGSSLVEYVAPDRIHEVISSGGKTTTELIIIKGQGTWQKINGKWIKSPVDLSDTIFKILDPKNFDEIRKAINIGSVQFVGADVLNGTPTLVYTYTTELGGDANSPVLKGSHKIWIGALDHRAYKIEGDTDSLLVKGAKTHSVTTVEYDVDIKIEPPI